MTTPGPRTGKPDILELIDYQCRIATDGSAPTLWFTHAIPALRMARREIVRLRKQVEAKPAHRPQQTLFGGDE